MDKYMFWMSSGVKVLSPFKYSMKTRSIILVQYKVRTTITLQLTNGESMYSFLPRVFLPASQSKHCPSQVLQPWWTTAALKPSCSQVEELLQRPDWSRLWEAGWTAKCERQRGQSTGGSAQKSGHNKVCCEDSPWEQNLPFSKGWRRVFWPLEYMASSATRKHVKATSGTTNGISEDNYVFARSFTKNILEGGE